MFTRLCTDSWCPGASMHAAQHAAYDRPIGSRLHCAGHGRILYIVQLMLGDSIATAVRLLLNAYWALAAGAALVALIPVPLAESFR